MFRSHCNQEHETRMVTHFVNKLAAYLVAPILFCLLNNVAFATSQGSLGSSSTATIDISVTVNQSIKVLRTNDLIFENTSANVSQPLCVQHNGYTDEAGVPYTLIVDDFKLSEQTTSAPFKVYLADDSNSENLIELHSGFTIHKQNNVQANLESTTECLASNLHLQMIPIQDFQDPANINEVIAEIVLMLSPE